MHRRDRDLLLEFFVAIQAREASIRQADGKAGNEPVRRCALVRLFLDFQIRYVAFLGLSLTDFGASAQEVELGPLPPLDRRRVSICKPRLRQQLGFRTRLSY